MSPSLRHWSPILILGKLPNSQYGKWLDLKRVIAHSQGRLQAKEEEEDSAQGKGGIGFPEFAPSSSAVRPRQRIC